MTRLLNVRKALAAGSALRAGLALRAAFCAAVLTAAFSCASQPKTDLALRFANPKAAAGEQTNVYPLGFRNVALVGSYSEDGTFAVEAVEWFTNWRDGWTEARFSASGRIAFEGTGSGARAVPLEPVILQSTERAQIRYRDAILSGDEAAAMMDRRLLRAETAAQILQESLGRREFSLLRAEKRKDRGRSFEWAAGSYLFPERYGYPGGTSASPKEPGNRSRGEGLDWDTAYTAALSDRIAEVRNSGTLWRDWEECAELFYLIYELER